MGCGRSLRTSGVGGHRPVGALDPIRCGATPLDRAGSDTKRVERIHGIWTAGSMKRRIDLSPDRVSTRTVVTSLTGRAFHQRAYAGTPAPVPAAPGDSKCNDRAMDDALWQRSAGELASLIRSREVSSREVVQAHLDRIEDVNAVVNAVTVTLSEDALAAADEADRGPGTGPFHGVPFTIKENIDCVGSATTQGVPTLANTLPPLDTPIVARHEGSGRHPIGADEPSPNSACASRQTTRSAGTRTTRGTLIGPRADRAAAKAPRWRLG